MLRRWLILASLAVLLVGAGIGSAEAQTRSAPAPTPPAATNPLNEPPMLTVGRVLGVVAGTAVGELLLHSMIGFPALPSVVVGGWAGWHVYVNYIEPELEQGTRKIAAAAD